MRSLSLHELANQCLPFAKCTAVKTMRENPMPFLKLELLRTGEINTRIASMKINTIAKCHNIIVQTG